jgi:hypothetical protein
MGIYPPVHWETLYYILLYIIIPHCHARNWSVSRHAVFPRQHSTVWWWMSESEAWHVHVLRIWTCLIMFNLIQLDPVGLLRLLRFVWSEIGEAWEPFSRWRPKGVGCTGTIFISFHFRSSEAVTGSQILIVLSWLHDLQNWGVSCCQLCFISGIDMANFVFPLGQCWVTSSIPRCLFEPWTEWLKCWSPG